MPIKTPWASSMGQVPMQITAFDGSMYEAVRAAAQKTPHHTALCYMGKTISYKKLIQNIDHCAAALLALGIKQGQRLTIALPNCPQAVYMLYGANKIGAVANMVHPLSAPKELSFYLAESESVLVITLDIFYDKMQAAVKEAGNVRLLITGAADCLGLPARIGMKLKQKTCLPKHILRWRTFLKCGSPTNEMPVKNREAVILYSGGTTGTTKGILLSNENLNSLAAQIIAANPMFVPGDRMLAAMPLFHGFGLGVCIHSILFNSGVCVLVPRFTPKSYIRDLLKYRCNFMAGVPTLFEALLRLKSPQNMDFSFLKGVFSGGDSLSPELKKRLDAFLTAHHCPVQVREGYGTTETVTACCLTPPHKAKESSIGIPLPGNFIKIVRPDTQEELPYGEEGEILLSGPTVMLGYMHHPEETAKTLQTHRDGRTWVYTGDLGIMDSEGFLYFKGRAKRLIVSSGYNIYPGQIENILDAHEYVHRSCVIGVSDSYKMQKVKAYVELMPHIPATEETRASILDHCRKHIAKYAMPCEIEFREVLPKTPVGKVNYRALEEQEKEKEQ